MQAMPMVNNRKARRDAKKRKGSTAVVERISLEEREFRNHKNKIAKDSRKKNR